eukprot:SM000080S22942  [mRNA]  locus=s80:214004:216926:- [translate_table: standard]
MSPYSRLSCHWSGHLRRLYVTAETAVDRQAAAHEYQQLRADNIRRNNEKLVQLGLGQAAQMLTAKGSMQKRQKRRELNEIGPLSLPLRRSKRAHNSGADAVSTEGRGLPTSYQVFVTGSDYKMDGWKKEDDPALSISHIESSVWKYICKEVTDPGPPYVTNGPEIQACVRAYSLGGSHFQDPALTKIYTMSQSASKSSLLAAGGHNGRISIFGVANAGSSSQSCRGLEDSCSSMGDSLLSWKAGSGWISHVQFLSSDTQDNTTLLLSSSNDCSVVLWDINKDSGAKESLPMKVASTITLHAQGIFGMHARGLKILTSSKDHTTALSVLNSGQIQKERVIAGHHSAAVRGVRFRDENIAADCGADGLICILDLRLADACATLIDNCHSSAVNVVEWHPHVDTTLLSASNDPHIQIHDIRYPASPIFTLSGHVSPNISRCRNIYRPCFAASGAVVATPGEGSRALSIYSMETGKAISRGQVDFDANLLMEVVTGGPSLWAASRSISKFVPAATSMT